MKTAVAAVIASVGLAGIGLMASPAGAGDRMQLACETGTLAGQTLERTNGASWWDVASRAVYTTKSMTIEADGDVVYAKEYGEKSGSTETCTGTRWDGSVWSLELAEPSK